MAVGRVVAADEDHLSVHTGPHVWLAAGLRVICSVAGEDNVTTFSTEIERVTADPQVGISMRRPEVSETFNRRTRPRVLFRQQLSWSRLNSGHQLVDETRGMSIDISETGCRFESAGLAPDEGELIAMQIQLLGERLTCLSYVIGINDFPGPKLTVRNLIRVAFAAMEDEDSDRLRRWVCQERGEALPATLDTAPQGLIHAEPVI